MLYSILHRLANILHRLVKRLIREKDVLSGKEKATQADFEFGFEVGFIFQWIFLFVASALYCFEIWDTFELTVAFITAFIVILCFVWLHTF